MTDDQKLLRDTYRQRAFNIAVCLFNMGWAGVELWLDRPKLALLGMCCAVAMMACFEHSQRIIDDLQDDGIRI